MFLFSQLHALFYDGDILLLYAVVGFLLIPVSKLKDRTVLIIAVILLLQPFECGRMLYATFNPDYVFNGNNCAPYAMLSTEAAMNGSFIDVLCNNIWNGQLYSNIWQVENGRLFQTGALFMFGMLLGRRQYFVESEKSIFIWRCIAVISLTAYPALYLLCTIVPESITNPAILISYNIVMPSLANFTFMVIYVSLFTLLWFYTGNGCQWQRITIPYGRMSLTNYITQSIIGVCIYYGFGFGLYKTTGATVSLFIGIAIFIVQLIFSRYWLLHHKQGPLEYLWRQGTWMKIK